ncbi:MAG TPA: hypothetical protein VF316_19130 [Polyangiaceae bacterium]
MPSPAPSDSIVVAAPAPAPTEIVVRPAGLRHGRWEAPAWAFYAMAGVLVLGAVLTVLFRLRILRLPARFRSKGD